MSVTNLGDNLTPLFGPQHSIGRWLAGERLTDEEFLSDKTPWLVVYVSDANLEYVGETDPITERDQKIIDEFGDLHDHVGGDW